MFKKDDKVKVIKGIKAFEGLTGTVLDTNGSQVKVKLNMSEDAEVQKNIINIFEDYQLELESLDLLKEEAEATFEDEEDEEETPEEIEKKLVEYEQMVQNAIRKRKPVEWGELKLYFANERDDNPDIKYETQVFYENGYPQKWDTPDWDSFDGWDYTLKLNFEELLGIAREVEDPFACLKKAGIYKDPEATGLLARDVLFVLDHLDDRVFDKLNEKAQQEYDEQGGHSRYDESLNSLKEETEVAFDNDENEKQVCCICGEEYTGYGNNAEPYKEGICCDKCNMKFVIPYRLSKLRSAKNESLKLTEEELKAWCSDNDANYYTQDIKNNKVIIRGLKEDLAEYDFKTKELKVFDYSGTTTQEQNLEDKYDDNYIRDYVYDVDMLDDKEYASWEFVSVIATAENISEDSVIQEAHDRGFKVFLIQASNYEKFVVAAEKITEDDIMEDFASYLEGNPKVTEII